MTCAKAEVAAQHELVRHDAALMQVSHTARCACGVDAALLVSASVKDPSAHSASSLAPAPHAAAANGW